MQIPKLLSYQKYCIQSSQVFWWHIYMLLQQLFSFQTNSDNQMVNLYDLLFV